MERLAKIGYEAYAVAAGGKNFRGDPMPTWAELPMPQKDSWIAATEAILTAIGGKRTEEAS